MPYEPDDLPGTLQRSPRKAQETFIETHESALALGAQGRVGAGQAIARKQD